MGDPYSVVLANLFMVSKETKWLSWSNDHFKVHIWYRFVDDGFALIQGPKSKILAWLTRIDTEDRPLRITFEISDKSVSFLDILISLGERFRTLGKLDTTIYRKSVALMPYTDLRSNHPPWMKVKWIKGELIRLIRLCSSQQEFIAQKQSFFRHLIDRGYARAPLCQILNSIKYSERGRLLSNPAPNPNQDCNPKPTLVLPWNHGLANLRLAQQVMLIGRQNGVGCEIRTAWTIDRNLRHRLAKL
jgi:hypothetical protein